MIMPVRDIKKTRKISKKHILKNVEIAIGSPTK